MEVFVAVAVDDTRIVWVVIGSRRVEGTRLVEVQAPFDNIAVVEGSQNHMSSDELHYRESGSAKREAVESIEEHIELAPVSIAAAVDQTSG